MTGGAEMTKTLLIYCGLGNEWTDEQISLILQIAQGYRLLYLANPANPRDWMTVSADFLARIRDTATNDSVAAPQYYVAAWGDEDQSWADQMAGDPDFLGFYWNGGLEDPYQEPPSAGLHGHPYTLWIPYTAGSVGIPGVVEQLNECAFPNEYICAQPNVFQEQYGRGFWDMFTAWRHARRYGIGLEIEYDERLVQTDYAKRFRYYKWFNMITPGTFTAVYGGDAPWILKVEEVL